MNNVALNDAHLHAVVRLALRAHGLAVSCQQVRQAIATRVEVGQWLRDDVVPAHLPPFASPLDYNNIAKVDPYIWERLPHMLGFGYEQAKVFQALVPSSKIDEDGAARLAAIFSAGIALTDYLTDEVGEREGVRTVLNPQAVAQLLDPTIETDAIFAMSYRHIADSRLRLLCTFVAMCGTGFRQLFARSGNRQAWSDLSATVGGLYKAELVASSARPASRQELCEMLPTIEAKSTLPFVATCRIIKLAHAPGGVRCDMEKIAEAMGGAISLVDDLVDFPVDFHRGAPNAIVLRLADVLFERGATWMKDADIYDVVDGVAEDILRRLRPAAFGIGEFDGPAALAALTFAQLTVAYWAGWQGDENGVLARARTTGHYAPSKPVAAATEMLLNEQRNGYREAIHHLRLPRLRDDGEVTLETHEALLFQRAIVLDALCDAFEGGGKIPGAVLAAEAITILRAKHRESPGGWNYVPEVPELPPDADDLGAMLQALYQVGGSDLAAACDEAIWFALQGALPNGGIPTWIVPAIGDSLVEKTMDSYVKLVGGHEVHPDVVSNLIDGLLQYDPERYQIEAKAAACYLSSVQEEQGAWSSRWYAGPYYGIFRAVAVLAKVAPGSQALERAYGFLRQHQRADGSWGDGEGDPLASAFALLTLVKLGTYAQEESIMRRGVAYLVGGQESDGGWPARPFICFPSSDATKTHTYGSRTITTAFCLKALAAITSATPADAPTSNILTNAAWPMNTVSTAAKDWS